MTSLLFGLIAALAWGLHDFLVRHVSQKAAAGPLMAVALAAGSAILAPLTLIEGWSGVSPPAIGLALLSGVAFSLASLGLYRAFAIGPVALVAPICGAYPLGSLALALASGSSVTARDWLAVAMVIAGIALVARQPGPQSGPRAAAILWAVLGAAGFALTFHFGQAAARLGGELPATLIARLTALALVLLALQVRPAPMAPALRHWRWLALMGGLDVLALGFVIASGSRPNPEYAAVTSAIFGIVTILLAWRFLGERLGRVQGAGLALVFAGIATLAAGS